MDLLPFFATMILIMAKIRGLYQKTDTKIWYFQPPMRKGHRPKPISLQTKRYEEALQIYQELRIDPEMSFTGGRLKTERDRFLAAKRRRQRHTEASTRNATGAINRFLDHVGNLRTSELTARVLSDYRDKIAGKSAATIQSEFAWLKSWIHWMIEDGVMATNPLKRAQLDLPRTVPTRAHLYCTRDERERMIEAAAGHNDLLTMMMLGFFTGMRSKEIVEARVGWLDLRGKAIRIAKTDTFTPKGKKMRSVPISDRLFDHLAGLDLPMDDRNRFIVAPKVRQGKAMLRWDCRRPWSHAKKKAGLDWATPHTMRHTFATLHLLAGTPLMLVAKWLGDDAQTLQNHYAGYLKHGDGISVID